MHLIGAHMSIGGGYYRAVEAANAVGCDCVQLFTKNNNQWKAKPITEEEATKFQASLAELGVRAPLSHTSYLINLASPNPSLLQQSIDAMVVELQRAAQLGIPFVVLHPGSFTTSSEAEGLAAVTSSLDEVFRQTNDLPTVCLLENTAGQGNHLGWRFEHLGEIISRCKFPKRLGVCIDTCHTFAAGYPLSDAADYRRTMDELDRVVGLSRVKAVHLNDSKMPFGSRKDRHEHIGRGEMGLKPFWNLLNDPRFAKIPMYLETEKGTENGEDLDAMNLRVLRLLIGKKMPVDSTSVAKSKTVPQSLPAPKRKPAASKSSALPTKGGKKLQSSTKAHKPARKI